MKSRIGILIALLLAIVWIFGSGGPFGREKPEGVVLSAPADGEGNRPPNLKKVSIDPNEPNRRSILSVVTHADDPDGDEVTFQYRWTVNRKTVSEAETLPLKRFKPTDIVSVEVTPSDGKDEGVPVHAASVQIGNAKPVINNIVLEPTHPKAGEALIAKVEALDADGDMIHFDYQWQVNGQVVSGNESNELPRGLIRSADKIVLFVTPKDPYSEGETKLSPMIAVDNHPPTIVSVPPAGLNDETFLYTVSSDDPDGDPLKYYLLEGPPGMKIDPQSGQLLWKVASLTEGHAKVAIGVEDGKGGKSEQRFTIQTQ
ncbi:MAG: Ig-like domain-containing protein [Nitrospiria bacterium]